MQQAAKKTFLFPGPLKQLLEVLSIDQEYVPYYLRSFDEPVGQIKLQRPVAIGAKTVNQGKHIGSRAIGVDAYKNAWNEPDPSLYKDPVEKGAFGIVDQIVVEFELHITFFEPADIEQSVDGISDAAF